MSQDFDTFIGPTFRELDACVFANRLRRRISIKMNVTIPVKDKPWRAKYKYREEEGKTYQSTPHCLPTDVARIRGNHFRVGVVEWRICVNPRVGWSGVVGL
jgi:hypothetical protein